MNEPEEPVTVSDLEITYRGTVYPWHCDHIGHMNVMWYVGKFDEATWQLFAGIGLIPALLREERRGMVAVDQRISYRRELRAGDVVLVRSGVLSVGTTSLRFCHVMEDAVSGEVCAVTVVTGVHFDLVARRAVALGREARAGARERITGFDPGM
ncbi:acyl-CoA thioesterase [Streptomyces griseorubiginosus]|uniref:acyl-CoA thioesterase n=1 Tax=Streptomyces griseorubiginosus TaxID=67304 RepID=UPI0036EAC1D2